MKKLLGCGGIAGGVVMLVVLVLVIWGVGAYNGLVRSDLTVGEAWANVESAYQRRMDLVPNLVETVKGAANFEQKTLTQVVEARAKASQIVLAPGLLNDPAKFREFQQAQAQMGGALGRLLATVEAYPELKANKNFLDLQSQLEGTENRINVERRRFNEAVKGYNTAVRVFPRSVIASITGFAPKPFFDADAGAEKAPPVKF